MKEELFIKKIFFSMDFLQLYFSKTYVINQLICVCKVNPILRVVWQKILKNIKKIKALMRKHEKKILVKKVLVY